MSEQTLLNEAENRVIIEGVLSENKLEAKNKDGKEFIMGELVIQTDEHSYHTIKMYANKYKKDNTENSMYKSFQTIMNEYKSIAEHGEEEADKVRITSGKISLNEYYGNDGQLKSYPEVASNFVNRLTPKDEYNPRAEFEVDVFIHSMVDEIKNEEAAGRLVIKTLIPMYGGRIIPFAFIVSDTEVADAFQSSYNKGDTLKLYGNLINTIHTQEIEEQVMVGKPKKKLIKKTVKEFEVTNGGFPYEDGDSRKYDMEGVKKAMTQREIDLQALKNKKSGGESIAPKNTLINKSAPAGVSKAAPKIAPKVAPKIKSSIVEDDDELPF